MLLMAVDGGVAVARRWRARGAEAERLMGGGSELKGRRRTGRSTDNVRAA